MQAKPFRPTLFLATAVAIAALGGCADVRRDPSSTVVGAQQQPTASAPQDRDVQPSYSMSVPF